MRMSKKVKCRKCEHSMSWAIPESVNDINIEYAERCLNMARRTLCCGWTMRTKPKDHEQYCKHYRRKSKSDIQRDENFDEVRLENLEQKIRDYRGRKGDGDSDDGS